jgi:hypothetical protein
VVGFEEWVSFRVVSRAAGLLEGWGVPPGEILAHLIMLGAVVVAVVFRDEVGQILLELVKCFCILATIMMVSSSALGTRTGVFPVGYLLALTMLLLLLHALFKDEELLGLSRITGGGAYASGWVEAWRWLQIATQWGGLTEFFVGLALLHVALLASAWKRPKQSRGGKAVPARLE